MIKLLKQKWVFRLAVLTPIFYLTYNLITGGINNANPLETILFYFGNVLLITLWISPIRNNFVLFWQCSGIPRLLITL